MPSKLCACASDGSGKLCFATTGFLLQVLSLLLSDHQRLVTTDPLMCFRRWLKLLESTQTSSKARYVPRLTFDHRRGPCSQRLTLLGNRHHAGTIVVAPDCRRPLRCAVLHSPLPTTHRYSESFNVTFRSSTRRSTNGRSGLPTGRATSSLVR